VRLCKDSYTKVLRKLRNTWLADDYLCERYRLPTTVDDLRAVTFRKKHLAKRAFVIGNGPSLQIQDLDKLQNEITLGCNKVYMAFNQTRWRPSYYFVADTLVYKQNLDAIKTLNVCPKLFPRHLLASASRIKDGIYYHEIVDQNFYPGLPGFGMSPISGFYWGSTVVYSMIQFAAYTGASRIYLLGVDCDFTINHDSIDELTKEITSSGDRNHFLPDYRAKGEKWYPPNLHVQEKTFQRAADWSRQSGIGIVNCTRGGKLEVFPRADLDQVLAQPSA